MNREPVSSSNIQSIGYDSSDQILEIEFNNGAVYQYFDVPEHVYTELISSPSVGGYLAKSIKGNFRFSRV
ncbi:TPA: KTSC domain-containing protein [Yersinia enterocolitica]|nr:KTSC domain-containing protein [Yersinia enterocolitica]HDL7739692.1 KTSC domain-containing protein [Yersinia enterocolitica]HDL8249790.1 KTSC domain-containing protein [Yersinia enterocolitica]HDM8279983.1 KTSC domain-containing protein [Yersinia enterocolitica]HDY4937382.1 KTSC domain-containing protein [Yersinia enterocolitica]